MIDWFWIHKKREDETHMEVMERGEHSIKQVKQEGKLNLSRDSLVSAITLALMSQKQQDTVLERYGTNEVSPVHKCT